jgi:anti-sigma-K factor RskA
MNYSDKSLISALASEYVLGTLRGAARDRFEFVRMTNPNVESAIHYWESQLNNMAIDIKPIAPDKDVWDSIEKRLGFRSDDFAPIDRITDVGPNENIPSDLPDKPSANQPWKMLSGFAVAASLVLAILFYQSETAVDMPTSIAVFSNAEAQTLWSVEVKEDKLFIRSTQNLPQLPNNDYQLWIVPASGQAPISIGLLQQSGGFELAKPEMFDDIIIAALAISLEPKGGSPTGAPTEVLYASELAAM